MKLIKLFIIIVKIEVLVFYRVRLLNDVFSNLRLYNSTFL